MSRFKLFIPLIVFAVLGLFFWKGLSLDPTRMPSALIDKSMPEFQLPIVKDAQRRVTVEDLKGQPSLLNVWATWCVACKVEHPYLNKLAKQGVMIFGVNYKDDTKSAQEWLAKLGDPYAFSVVDADGRLGIDLGVFGAPETYVLDREGVIRYKHVGVVDERVWQEIIQPIMQRL
ncbi:MAG: thiol:disulfide interchange protein DsbE [Candidatus Pelagadaptatus aseana]|uniref:DsbE family thiol:disulfide interchange protein n=1 Tax=Candidatus Pelagadaptatus aseana TaxID=3120508 RepID=UPI0039B31B51